MPSNSALLYGVLSFLYILLLTIFIVLLYILFLSLMVAMALSRLAVVHNSAAVSERVYYAFPWLSCRRRRLTAARDAARRRHDASLERLCPVTRQPSPAPRPPAAPVNCAVCLDEVAVGDAKRRLPCKHEYHQTCIDLWIGKGANRCPLCSRPILEWSPPPPASSGRRDMVAR